MNKELLIKLRNKIAKVPELYSGLCLEVTKMFIDDEISYEEAELLRNFISSNRPKRGKDYDNNLYDSQWYWPCGEVAPRLEWLNDQIKRFER